MRWNIISDAQEMDCSSVELLTFFTRCGWMGIVRSNSGIRQVLLPHKSRDSIETAARAKHTWLQTPADIFDADALVERLQRYFLGEIVVFSDKVDVAWATPFQRSVWDVARSIPYGQTQSYGWIARSLGNPKASRAVGQALGRNPVPVIVPCHRVVRSTGSLGGFSGGLELKQDLLDIERQG